ncbi:MAG: ferric reductase-like transmembrane domain-containing protein [Deferrisomatales bacterium]|nr:ferric reductase-like transmembrane domain-containing protein [Deferrisomatales bacterium]
MSPRFLLRATFWIAVYLAFVALPLLALFVGPMPPGRGFWRELSVGLGFAGVSMMGFQFFLTGRFRRITSPYGVDVVYHFHRRISLIAFGLIVAHAAILLAQAPATLALLNPATGPWWITAGTAGVAAFGVIIAASLERERVGLSYEAWRVSHALLSVTAVGLSVGHIAGVGYYVQGPLKVGLWVTIVAAWVFTLVYVRLIKPLGMLRRPWVVDEVLPERGRSWTLTLRPDGHPGMVFEPGQFAWLKVDRSPFAIREHPFSFSSSSLQQDRVQITIKELGDFTSTIGSVTPGTRAYLDGPYGSFSVDRHPARGYVFIAAGVGITPVMCILRTLADRRDRRPLLLMYQSRNLAEATFREELEDLRLRLDLDVVHVLSRPAEGWTGERGRLSAETLARYLPADRLERDYFVCGPEPVQMAVKTMLERLGLPLEQCQSESFNFV